MREYAYQPDMIVDSIADLCDPDKLLHEVLPTMNREDDTPHDIREWVAAHCDHYAYRRHSGSFYE